MYGGNGMHRKYEFVGIVLSIFVIFLFKKTNPKSDPISKDEVLNKSSLVIEDEAQNILRTRFAKGEITKKEYKTKKTILQKYHKKHSEKLIL